MSNFAYPGMEWLMAVWDLLRGKPTHHLRPARVQPGMTAVDYACGPGHYTVPLAEAVGPAGRVFAVDIQPLALQTVARLAARRGLQNVTPVLAEGYDTGLPSATADLAVFLDAFHMVEDPEALLREPGCSTRRASSTASLPDDSLEDSHTARRRSPMRTSTVVVAALVICAALGFAEVAENFEAGGLEFGGEFLFEWIPSYAIFDSADRAANEGEYQLFVEGGASVGWFVIDRLSLVAQLSSIYQRGRYQLSPKSVDQELSLGLFLGAEYYLPFLRRFAASFGLNAGAYFISDLKDIDLGVKEDGSWSGLQWLVEPSVAGYLFLTDRLAPFVRLAPQFSYWRQLRSGGVKYEYPDGYEFIKDVYLDFRTTVGLKYFLPAELRSRSKRDVSLWEYILQID